MAKRGRPPKTAAPPVALEPETLLPEEPRADSSDPRTWPVNRQQGPPAPLMDRKSVADFFSVTEDTVSRWVHSGLLTMYRTIGGRPRFKRIDVERRFEMTATGCNGHTPPHDPAML